MVENVSGEAETVEPEIENVSAEIVPPEEAETPLEEVHEETISEAQAIEGYACSCGATFNDLGKFRSHQALTRNDREHHQSQGRVNLATGEITMPPAKDRTKEQWAEAKYGKKEEKPQTPAAKPSTAPKTTPIRQTEIMAQAVEIKFVPRVYTIDYSPILRAAQDAAIKFFDWRPEMPLGNFIDTVCYLFFKEKGITLAGYIVEETEEERAEREAAIAARKEARQMEEVTT